MGTMHGLWLGDQSYSNKRAAIEISRHGSWSVWQLDKMAIIDNHYYWYLCFLVKYCTQKMESKKYLFPQLTPNISRSSGFTGQL